MNLDFYRPRHPPVSKGLRQRFICAPKTPEVKGQGRIWPSRVHSAWYTVSLTWG